MTKTALITPLTAALAWRDTPPSRGLPGISKVGVPAASAIKALVPEGLPEQLLAKAYALALRLSGPEALAQEILEHSAMDPTGSTKLRLRVQRRAMASAAGTGAVLGLAGALGLAADAPVLLVQALRVVIRVGYCYGTVPSPTLTMAIFALASADTPEEKQRAWEHAMQAPETSNPTGFLHDDDALRDGLERAAEREFAKAALNGSLQKLAGALVSRLGTRKLAGALPFVGAVVGGAVNAHFIQQVAQAAGHVFVARQAEQKALTVVTAQD